jgi:antitoxin VapB
MFGARSSKKSPYPARAKIFLNGRSQAVRLPMAFRMSGTEVSIRREGEAVILEPIRTRGGWPEGYWEKLDLLTRGIGDDFELPDDPVPVPIRPRGR